MTKTSKEEFETYKIPDIGSQEHSNSNIPFFLATAMKKDVSDNIKLKLEFDYEAEYKLKEDLLSKYRNKIVSLEIHVKGTRDKFLLDSSIHFPALESLRIIFEDLEENDEIDFDSEDSDGEKENEIERKKNSTVNKAVFEAILERHSNQLKSLGVGDFYFYNNETLAVPELPMLDILFLSACNSPVAKPIINSAKGTISQLYLSGVGISDPEEADFTMPNLTQLNIDGTNQDKLVQALFDKNSQHITSLMLDIVTQYSCIHWPKFPQLKELSTFADFLPLLSKCHKTLECLRIRSYYMDDPKPETYSPYLKMSKLKDLYFSGLESQIMNTILKLNQDHLDLISFHDIDIEEFIDIQGKMASIQTVLLSRIDQIQYYTGDIKRMFPRGTIHVEHRIKDIEKIKEVAKTRKYNKLFKECIMESFDIY